MQPEVAAPPSGAFVCPLGNRQVVSTTHPEIARFTVPAAHMTCDPHERTGPFRNEIIHAGHLYRIFAFKTQVDLGGGGKGEPSGAPDCRCTGGECDRAKDFTGAGCAPSGFPLPGAPRYGLLYRLENDFGFHHVGDGDLQGFRVLQRSGVPSALCLQLNDDVLNDNSGFLTVVVQEEVVDTRCEAALRPALVTGRTCDEPSCVTASCSSDGQCCTQSCNAGRCASCIGAFEPCTRNENCCSCACVAGHCR